MTMIADTYRHILETMHDGVMALSDGGEIVLFNQAAADILGFEAGQALGKLLMEAPYVENEKNDEFTQTILSAVYKKGESIRTGAPYVRPDGKELFLEVASSFLKSEDGQSKGVVIVFTDITELRTRYEKEKELTTRLSDAYRELEGKTATMGKEMRGKRVSRRMGIVVGLLVLLGTGFFLLQRYTPIFESSGQGREQSGAAAFAHEAQLRPVSLKVSLTGYFEPLEIMNIVSPFNGRILSKNFAFGQKVEKGATLLQLDTSEQLVEMRDAESVFIKALQEYEKVVHWLKSMEVSNARRTFVKTKKALDASRNKLEAGKDLLDRGIIPENEYESLRTQFENLELDFSSAQEQLESVRRRGSAENVRVAEMAMKNARFKLDSIRNKVANAAIIAPVDGLVIRSRSSGNKESRSVEVGAGFNEGEVLLTIGNMEGFTVRTKADEVDMIKLGIGQPVAITGDAFPDTVLNGRIESISAQAEVALSSGKPATFDVVVLVDKLTQAQRERVRLGMMATMEVVVYENPEALLVPINAVRRRGGGYFVLLVTPSGVEPREVAVGMTTLDAVEIKDGLVPGDRVQAGGR